MISRFAGAAGDSRGAPSGREFSTTVLDHLARDKRTIYQSDELPTSESLVQVKALVASPVLLPNGEVAGSLYGVRRTPRGLGISITPLEAQMVQVLATAVGIGLARVAPGRRNRPGCEYNFISSSMIDWPKNWNQISDGSTPRIATSPFCLRTFAGSPASPSNSARRRLSSSSRRSWKY